ncbi:benzaldehyde dehydrogenase [Rhodococcus fascians]|uniref:benzaldehyde dehydrogenase n=1 Tax=Rhodococcoides fascians TaxID=1828 RepID=UPI00195F93B6|nr:benzaldehyde dehydrogenase [Rhodococcus fascians]MBM7244429.1 benzaldehyde dehydrogenase [Rhodococcus fascians]MBY3808045.1 benzaldehyde dehydrogenase [Rhodococcus fascians]MBY3839593.1 benzaldehyde dehydrogenase [Rhodococcus fascians]MBY3847856.1 benzaldehyde dehydrogenase [Rhodococcus fascians]MBY3851352.1 benzaldehyde dehydrogenase [Rhodococcus fascians]
MNTLLSTPVWESKVFNGEWVAGGAEDRSVVEPATGKQLTTVGMATAEDVAIATSKAVLAQQHWAALPFSQRARVLRRAGQLFEDHAEEIGEWIIREAGGIGPKAAIETHTAAEECFNGAALAAHPIGEVLQSEQPRLSFSRRVPVGTVGVIAPFNFPLILSIRAVAPALALGNAVILKPDPRTAICGGVVLARIFEEAGLPPGVFSVLPGGADVGEALVVHPSVRVIAFTGSTRAGRAVGELAGRHLKRAHLELGGNNALIVLDDVDIEKAVSVGAFGSFMHQGQICMQTGRHIVHERIVDDYIAALAEHADRLPVGDPFTSQVALGPIIDAGQRDRIHEMVGASVQAGATLSAGGTFDELFYRPTVLGHIPLTAPAFADEVFGPVAPVTSFATIDEAVDIANQTEYGLSLGILTVDAMRGLELSQRIPSGLVHINDQTVGDEAIVPFGGLGNSGNGGRVGGIGANLDAFTETQWVTAQSSLPTYPF